MVKLAEAIDTTQTKFMFLELQQTPDIELLQAIRKLAQKRAMTIILGIALPDELIVPPSQEELSQDIDFQKSTLIWSWVFIFRSIMELPPNRESR